MDSEQVRKDQIMNEMAKLPTDKPIPFAEVEKLAPTLAQEIKMATENANNASKLDQLVAIPNQIEISDKNSKGDVAVMRQNPLAFTNDGAYLRIEKQSLSNHSLSDIRATIEHEVMHKIQKETDGWNFLQSKFTPEKGRQLEYMADRGANSAVDEIGAVLKTTQKYAWGHNFDATNSDHPNNRDRVGALLAEAYGNDAFKFSGDVSGQNGHFTPHTDKDGVAVTEEGRRVSNWQAVEAAIKVQVEADLKLLDQSVSSGLTDQEITDFKQHVSDTAKLFRAQNPLQLGAVSTAIITNHASEDTQYSKVQVSNESLQNLAESFLQAGMKNKEVMQANIAKDSRMADAYTALALSTEFIEKDKQISSDEKLSRIATVHSAIAEGIRGNNFPVVEKMEKNSEASLA